MSKYENVINRKNDIMKKSVGIDYSIYEYEGIGFDFEEMMNFGGYSFDEIRKIQLENGVGNTPLIELKNITNLVRKNSDKGKGARIFIKDEASNLSGSFKARRAAISVYHAKKLGYKGVIAATSGNYGAAVAAQAAKHGLKCIIVQECYDSSEVGQPEIIEKARKCEAYGAEVIQLTVGPELFYTFLTLLEETNFFNASLYTPFGISGVETLGFELIEQVREFTGKDPDIVLCTNAGGGNLTGTARGVKKAKSNALIYGASVNLYGLHMASNNDFNKKSFTTGHTGFGIPFSTFPDRSDVPRSAARPLRYMDRYLLVNQGEVFFITEMLARIEGLERGPAGNVSLAAAFALAKELDEDKIIVVQETEYTGAGKHIQPQLSFARKNNIELVFGDPVDEVPGKNIIFPKSTSLIKVKDIDMDKLKVSYIKKAIEFHNINIRDIKDKDIKYLIEETKTDVEFIKEYLSEL